MAHNIKVDGGRHYNCCKDWAEPDWAKEYTSLVLGGCINDPDDEGHVLGNVPRADAEFFTVYGRDHDGLAMAITDIMLYDPNTSKNAFEEAVKVGMELAEISGLTLNIEC